MDGRWDDKSLWDTQGEDNWVNRMLRPEDAPHRGSSSKGVDDWSLRLNKKQQPFHKLPPKPGGAVNNPMAGQDVEGMNGVHWAISRSPGGDTWIKVNTETGKPYVPRPTKGNEKNRYYSGYVKAKDARKPTTTKQQNKTLKTMGLKRIGDLKKQSKQQPTPKANVKATPHKKKKNDNDYYFNILNR